MKRKDENVRIPKHIGIIPDGNRRWANNKGLNKQEGYEHGLNPGLKLLQVAKQYGVEEITYYGFTVDNCKRPKEQIQAFVQACVDAVEIIAKENVQLFVIGNTESKFFPKQLLPYTKFIDIKETNNNKIKVNFLVNYGWDWDLKNGFLSKMIPRMDMIIRWGGMRRLSGFLPIQSVYADFFIIEDLWPDFCEQHFYEAMEWYQKQDVTLGG